jgi:hypothetical protein
MNALRFIALVTLALISYSIGIVYGFIVRVFRWATYLLMFDVAKMLINLYELGVKMSSVLNATAATWLTAWLIAPGAEIRFGEYYPASAVIGQAHHQGVLSKVGQWVRAQLEALDPGHCERAAKRHGLIFKVRKLPS